ATTEIYTLSLHDALPIFVKYHEENRVWPKRPTDINFSNDTLKLFLTHFDTVSFTSNDNSIDVDYKFSKEREFLAPIEFVDPGNRSEEHTSELQSRENLVC